MVPPTKASHIVGGDLTVKWIGPTKNDFQIQLRVFRSCQSGSAGMPTTGTVRVHDLVTYAQTTSFNLTSPAITLNLPFGDDCFTPTGLCVDLGVFTQNVTLPDNPNGYFLEYQICCRNAGITNLANPTGSAMTFYCEIPDPGNAATLNNSNPDMGDYPMDAYFCVGTSKNFSFNVTDVDGDSLHFSLVTPLDQQATPTPPPAFPYPDVVWASVPNIYSLADMVGGLPPMTINSATGVMTAAPNLIGTYVFGVKVEEFRNGVKIGETRRDAQYEALNCTVDIPPSDLTGIQDSTLYFPFGTETCQDIIFRDLNVTDTIFLELNSVAFQFGATTVSLNPYQTNPDLYLYTYNSGDDSVLIPANTYIDSLNSVMNVGTVASRFCWSPDCEQISETPYEFNVYGFSIGCEGRVEDTLNFKIEVGLPNDELSLIPNVITPNGDGMNDVYKIAGISNPCTDKIKVQIYNRWGLLVFESAEYPEFEWDGTNKGGSKVSAGTYFVLVSGIFGEETVTLDQRSVTVLDPQ